MKKKIKKAARAMVEEEAEELSGWESVESMEKAPGYSKLHVSCNKMIESVVGNDI